MENCEKGCTTMNKGENSGKKVKKGGVVGKHPVEGKLVKKHYFTVGTVLTQELIQS